jgi:nucleoside-triphosphatase
VDIRSQYRVEKYGVDIRGFDNYLASLSLGGVGDRPVIIDEIGKMECFSRFFREVVDRLLDSERLFISTIAKRGTPFIESVKMRQDVALFEITRDNRDNLLEPVLSIIRSFVN